MLILMATFPAGTVHVGPQKAVMRKQKSKLETAGGAVTSSVAAHLKSNGDVELWRFHTNSSVRDHHVAGQWETQDDESPGDDIVTVRPHDQKQDSSHSHSFIEKSSIRKTCYAMTESVACRERNRNNEILEDMTCHLGCIDRMFWWHAVPGKATCRCKGVLCQMSPAYVSCSRSSFHFEDIVKTILSTLFGTAFN